MDLYLARSPADCAASFKKSASNAASFTSPFLVFAQTFDAWLSGNLYKTSALLLRFALWGMWIVMGIFFFGVGALLNFFSGFLFIFIGGAIWITVGAPVF